MGEKMFNKITFISKDGISLDGDVKDKIMSLFGDKDIGFVSFKDVTKEVLRNADLVITFGGDGTFVRAGNLIENAHIIGINSSPQTSEGALTEININELHLLDEIIKGNYKVEDIHRAKVKLNGKILDENAVNEVYIGANSHFHSARYVIKHNGEEEEHRSSGVIVTTGAGSKAWFKSAGGEPFGPNERKLSYVVREPYIGERVFKSKKIKGEILEGEKIIFESRRDFGGVIVINEAIYDFNTGDVAEIELSDKPLKVIKLKNNQ